MSRKVRGEDGKYHIAGKTFDDLVGSRRQVYNKTAYKTEGGLTRRKLVLNKWGRIVSAKKHRTAKKERRLEKAGFFAKKGKFGVVNRSMKGGDPEDGNPDLSTGTA